MTTNEIVEAEVLKRIASAEEPIRQSYLCALLTDFGARRVRNAIWTLIEDGRVKFDLNMRLSIGEKLLVLLSGGVDSACALLRYHPSVASALFVSYGQPAQEMEKNCAQRLTSRYGYQLHYTQVDIPPSGMMVGDVNPVVAHRNAVLLSVGASWAVHLNCSKIVIGCNADDSDVFPDCRFDFVESMIRSLTVGDTPVGIVAPFIHTSKKDVITEAINRGLTRDDVWTCYMPVNNAPCGSCLACSKSNVAWNMDEVLRSRSGCWHK